MKYTLVIACLFSASVATVHCMERDDIELANLSGGQSNNNAIMENDHEQTTDRSLKLKNHGGGRHGGGGGKAAAACIHCLLNACMSCENACVNGLEKCGCDRKHGKIAVRGCGCLVVIGSAVGAGVVLGQSGAFAGDESSDFEGSNGLKGGAFKRGGLLYQLMCGGSSSDDEGSYSNSNAVNQKIE